MCLRFTLSLAALLVFRLSAQQLGSVQGRVVDTVRGSAIPEAKIMLGCMLTKRSGAPCGETASSIAADGTFRFENVEPGSYLLVPHAAGYLSRPGRATPVAEVVANQITPLITVPIIPVSSISGTVKVQDGSVVPGVKVILAAERYFGPHLSLNRRGSATTDQSGAFAFTDIAPGRYYVAAESRAGAFYFSPGVLRLVEASKIRVPEGGSATGVLIELGTTETHSVTGRVTGISEGIDPLTFKVRLLSPDTEGVTTAYATPEKDGSFRFARVTAGDYQLRLIRNIFDPKQPGAIFMRIIASQLLSIGQSDVTNLILSPTSPISIHGKIELANDSSPNIATSVSLHPEEQSPASTGGTVVEGKGTFSISQLEPVKYIVQIGDVAGYYVQSVEVNGKNSPDWSVDLSQNQTAEMLIRMRSGTANLSGKVQDPRASIWLLPAEESPHEPLRTDAADGQFIFKDVPPGSYRAVSLTPHATDFWKTPEGQRVLREEGTKITVKERDQLTIAPTELTLETIDRLQNQYF